MSKIKARRVAIVIIGVFAFAQTSLAFSGCAIERGDARGTMAVAAEQSGTDCDMPGPAKPKRSAYLCAVHCAPGLEAAGPGFTTVAAVVERPVLAVVKLKPAFVPRTGLFFAPPGAPPHRILLHSFLI
jgi:hypothetical protein